MSVATGPYAARASRHRRVLVGAIAALLVCAGCGGARPNAGSAQGNSGPSATRVDGPTAPPPSPGGEPDVVVRLDVTPTAGPPGTSLTVTTTNAALKCSRSSSVRMLFVDSRSFARGLTADGSFILPPTALTVAWQATELRATYLLSPQAAPGRALIRLECGGILVGVTDFIVA